MKSMPRRTFLGTTAGALAASPLMAAGARGPNETLGVGLIGVGNRGSVLLKNLLQIPGVEVRAICDIDPERLENAAKVVEEAGRRRPKLTTDGSWKEILAADGLDAIVSAIPCDLHAACYLDVIAAGKDLYGEKPMCLTPGRLRRGGEGGAKRASRSCRSATSGGPTRDSSSRSPPSTRRDRRPRRGPDPLVELLGPALRLVRQAEAVGRLDGRAGGPQLGRASTGPWTPPPCGRWRWAATTSSATASPTATSTTTTRRSSSTDNGVS